MPIQVEGFGSGIVVAGITGLMTVGTIPVATGATTLDDSLLTDDGVTLTYTGTGGIVAPVFKGNVALPVHATSIAVTAMDGTKTVWPCDTSAGGFTITLPVASTFPGRLFIVKKVSTDGNVLTIAGAGPDKIDGNATISFAAAYTAVSLISDGTNWMVV